MIQRADDNEDTLKKRLESYHKSTVPVVGFYQKKGILTTLDASQKNDTVYQIIKKVIDNCSGKSNSSGLGRSN